MLTSREAMGLMGVGQTVQSTPAFTTTAGATCPSQEQIQGITDPNDPCQGGAGTVLPNVQPTASPAPTVESAAQILADIEAGLQPGPLPTGAVVTPTSAPGTLLGVSTSVWLIGGAAVLAVLLISSGGRRR